MIVDRVFHRAVVAASRNLSLFTHSFGKFVGALFATPARYIKARESSDALKNSILPLPLYRFRTASRVFICQRVAANEIFSPSSSLSFSLTLLLDVASLHRQIRAMHNGDVSGERDRV